MRQNTRSIAWFLSGLSVCIAYRADAQLIVPGFVVENYANVPNPTWFSFDNSSGVLYVGREEGSTPSPIHRIGPGGFPVEEYGPNFGDPDSVLFDAAGLVSLAGHAADGSRGYLCVE